jgi:hypothetical protein
MMHNLYVGGYKWSRWITHTGGGGQRAEAEADCVPNVGLF